MIRGEPGFGKWSVVVKDTEVNDHEGIFEDWKLSLWGECIDASSQTLLPMPMEDDDDDGRISANVTTTTVAPGSASTGVMANPSDHIDRPVNTKPTSTPKPAESSTAPSSADNTPPHYFPIIAVSKRTQIWIYGALAIIILFCAGLGTYFYLQRRKRIRNNRSDYEFDMLDDEDGAAGKIGTAKGRRVKKRAGELYDAFAGESDEELLSEDDEKGYKDKVEEYDDEDRGRSQSRAEDEKQ